MQSRLFLGIRLGSDQKESLISPSLKFTMKEDKLYLGYPLPANTTLQELEKLEKQLVIELTLNFPNTRFSAPVLFSEWLIG